MHKLECMQSRDQHKLKSFNHVVFFLGACYSNLPLIQQSTPSSSKTTIPPTGCRLQPPSTHSHTHVTQPVHCRCELFIRSSYNHKFYEATFGKTPNRKQLSQNWILPQARKKAAERPGWVIPDISVCLLVCLTVSVSLIVRNYLCQCYTVLLLVSVLEFLHDYSQTPP